MNEKQEDDLINALKLIVDQMSELTGEKFLIGYAFTKGDIIVEGCASSEGIEWGTACKMLVGITGFVSDYYGNLEE